MQTKKFVQLYRQRNSLRSQLTEIENEIEVMGEEILDQMADSGTQNLTLDSGATIYVSRKMIPRVILRGDESTDEANERAYDALIAAGLPELAKKRFFWQSVASRLKELEEFPPELEGVIDPYIKYSVAVRNAGKEE